MLISPIQAQNNLHYPHQNSIPSHDGGGRLKSNNNQYQFISMLTDKPAYRCPKRREISFSDLEDSSFRHDRHASPSPASRDRLSRATRVTASPLHNLHYKYLPQNYVSPQKANMGKEEPKYSCRTPLNKKASSNVNEITKINTKIRNILQSLQQEQRRKEIYVNKYSKNQPKPPITIHPLPAYQKQHSIGYTTPLREKNLNTLGQNYSGKYSNMSSIKGEQKENYSIKRQPHPKLKCSRRSSEEETKSHTHSFNLLNSRYLNYSASRVKRLRLDDTVVRGKNIDQEIDKIQSKMKELDKLKKSLGMEFGNSKATDKGSEAETTLKESKESEIKFQSKFVEESSMKASTEHIENIMPVVAGQKNQKIAPIHPKKEQPPRQTKEGELKKSEFYNTNENFNQQDVNVPKILRMLPSKRKKVNKQQRAHTEHAPFLQVQSVVSEFFNTNTQTPQSIQTGRQIPPQIKASDVNAALVTFQKRQQKNQLKRLLYNLQRQIRADEQLRKIKKWFQRAKNELKWCELQKTLRKNSINLSTSAMREVFSITSQQENPFYTPREQDFTVEDLVQAYKSSQENWTHNIVHNYSRSKLQQQQFVQSNIDISKRGSVSIEDLVRYINYELDTFYRNRDVHLIYQRLAGNAGLKFEKLVQAITHKH